MGDRRGEKKGMIAACKRQQGEKKEKLKTEEEHKSGLKQ